MSTGQHMLRGEKSKTAEKLFNLGKTDGEIVKSLKLSYTTVRAWRLRYLVKDKGLNQLLQDKIDAENKLAGLKATTVPVGEVQKLKEVINRLKARLMRYEDVD